MCHAVWDSNWSGPGLDSVSPCLGLGLGLDSVSPCLGLGLDSVSPCLGLGLGLGLGGLDYNTACWKLNYLPKKGEFDSWLRLAGL